MESIRQAIRENPLASVITVAIVVFIIMFLIALTTGLIAAKHSEYLSYKLPWGTKVKSKAESFWPLKSEYIENEHSLLANDLVGVTSSLSSDIMAKQEYFDGKTDSPELTKYLWKY